MTNKKKVLLIGANGRMGREITAILAEHSLLIFSAGVDRNGSEVFSSINDVKGDFDIVIDFSLPDLFNEVCEWCVDTNTPLVSGTTGLSSEQLNSLVEISQKIPTLWAPNMSLGVHFVSYLLEKFNILAGDFDFQIEEFHHRHKKDKPSGTALFLQQKLQDSVQVEVPEPLSIRGGGIFGIHKVWAMSEEETICVEHNALGRKVFAKGAVRAAEWLLQQSNGLYEIKNVLGL